MLRRSWCGDFKFAPGNPVLQSSEGQFVKLAMNGHGPSLIAGNDLPNSRPTW
jgi:hypothetical protein